MKKFYVLFFTDLPAKMGTDTENICSMPIFLLNCLHFFGK